MTSTWTSADNRPVNLPPPASATPITPCYLRRRLENWEWGSFSIRSACPAKLQDHLRNSTAACLRIWFASLPPGAAPKIPGLLERSRLFRRGRQSSGVRWLNLAGVGSHHVQRVSELSQPTVRSSSCVRSSSRGSGPSLHPTSQWRHAQLLVAVPTPPLSGLLDECIGANCRRIWRIAAPGIVSLVMTPASGLAAGNSECRRPRANTPMANDHPSMTWGVVDPRSPPVRCAR